jgi:diguanylate cyclase (GGDEF)-like protein
MTREPSSVWYILSIAILNLGIGFALAVALRGPVRAAASSAVRAAARHVDHYGARLAALNDQLDHCGQSAEEVSACVAQMGAVHREFLDESGEVVGGVLDATAEATEAEAARTRLAELWRQQCAEVARAEQAVKSFQPDGDLGQKCRQFAEQNSELLQNNHRLRDALDEAMADVARAESWTARNAGHAEGAGGEGGLEAFWAEWWNGDPDRVRQISLAAVEVDELAQLNRRCGPLGSDRVLQVIGQILTAEGGSQARVSRTSGGTFLVLLPETELRDATTCLERARQRIERTHFLSAGETVEVTISCGLTESGQADATKTLMERIEATLAEAKRYGRNRTFVHEGKFPTPVVPPNFEIEEREIEL